MKPKLIVLNIALAAALGLIAWQTRNNWLQAQSKRESTLNAKVKPLPAPQLKPEPKPEAVTAAKYADVATNDLFSKDRNPNVIIEPPKVEPPKVMPPLPVVFGVLGLPSGTRAIMAEKVGLPSHPVHEGDKVGEFTIAALDPQNVTFDWDGKQISKKIDDLIDRSTGPGAAPGVAPAAASPPPAAPRPAEAPSNVKPGPGKDTGGGFRACVAGDSSPSGTVVDGFRKNVVKTPFGESCNWLQIQ